MYQSLHWLALGLFAIAVALWPRMVEDRSRLRAAVIYLGFWAAIAGAGFLPPGWAPPPLAVREVSLAFVELAAAQIAVIVIFELVLRRVRVPKFASEMLMAVLYTAIVVSLLYRLGVNVTGIFATSAVATAVVGLALQDMLSNIAGGVVLELEGGIRQGDYVKVGEYSGWVQSVRLRFTSIRTSDNDVVILPNSQLTRNPVLIVTPAHRQFVPFTMSYALNPQQVVEAVQNALRGSSIPGVLNEPAPLCIVREMAPDFVRYAAVVFLAEPGREAYPISAVMTRVYFALERAGMPAAAITHLLEMRTGDGAAREIAPPADILRTSPIMRVLSDPDLDELATHLQRLGFAPGETIIRQHEEGSSMYFIFSGQVGIDFRSPEGSERRLAQMGPGDFFGEASLLTGEPRTASALALSRVECYRLEKAGLEGLMSRRAELADDIALVMAHRQVQLAIVRERLGDEEARLREAENRMNLRVRIRRFFGLKAGSTTA